MAPVDVDKNLKWKWVGRRLYSVKNISKPQSKKNMKHLRSLPLNLLDDSVSSTTDRHASIPENPIAGLQRKDVKYCLRCKTYSYPGTVGWAKVPLKSPGLLSFLLKKLDLILIRLHSVVLDAKIMDPGYTTNKIYVDLKLQENGPNGSTVKELDVDFLAYFEICSSCSRAECSSPGGRKAMVGLLSKFAEATRQKTCGDSFATTITCPIRREDLILLPSEVSAALGHIGPVVTCTRVISGIMTLFDPMELREFALSIEDYWSKAPFTVLKTRKDLEEFVVVGVRNVSRGPIHTLYHADLVSKSDLGKNDDILSVTTHLGYCLRPGDYALGYDLREVSTKDIEGNIRRMLSDVVLIRKKHDLDSLPKKLHSSSEYSKFLTDLEKCPESVFSISLSDEKQNSDSSPVKKAGNVVFELEDLLADLNLSNQED